VALGGADGESIADAFTVGAAALAHVRADPLLPPELCGRNWPGGALRDAYAEYRTAFASAVRDWFRAR
jgi:phenylacetic acid degradation operon negative regulatory protein